MPSSTDKVAGSQCELQFFMAATTSILVDYTSVSREGKIKMTNNRPVLPGRCYWVVPQRFLAGGYPYNPGIDDSHDFLCRLLDNGIDSFIDLTEEDELTHYQPELSKLTSRPIFYLRASIVDFSVPTLDEMQKLIKTINQLLSENHNIYLHCRGGIGRTGTVVGCWLRSVGNDGEQALTELAHLFSACNAARFTSSPETEEQREFIKTFVNDANKL